MNCCTNTYDLGCFDSCDTIQLPFEYEQNGTHKIEFETQFRFKFSQEGTAGETVELDLTLFPENTDLTLKIFNPDGTRFVYTVGSSMYDCFTMRIDIFNSSTYTPMGTTPTCCTPKILAMSGVATKTLVYDDWSKFGQVPTIEVYYKEGSSYITIPVEPIFDSMPSPTSITINIPAIPADTWYIKLS